MYCQAWLYYVVCGLELGSSCLCSECCTTQTISLPFFFPVLYILGLDHVSEYSLYYSGNYLMNLLAVSINHRQS